MAAPTLRPASTISVSRLPITGAAANVDSSENPLPFGIYTRDAPEHSNDTARTNFKKGAVDQVAYVYKKLGGDIIDIELTEYQVYSAYEEAVLEYSYIINTHQAKNVLSDLLGSSTGSFDQDGELTGAALSGSNVELKYPKFTFAYSRRIADGAIEAAGLGGLETIYSASFESEAGQQDYDLQKIISENAALTASLPYSNNNQNPEGHGVDRHIGGRKIRIKKVFYKTPHAMWRFFGYYGGLNTVGNLSNYGQFADDSTFELIPAWQNKTQAMAFEDSIYTRMSHYSYELKNNQLRLFPSPQTHSPSKFWVEFTIQSDPWDQQSGSAAGESGVNNLNTLPFANIRYDKINSIGKQWIRRFSLALCKEMLGQVRGKFATIPIPGESVTLNASELLSQAAEEQDKLREELKTTLDEMTYQRLAEGDSAKATATERVMQSIPAPVFVG